ncbi:oxygen-regulated protein 1 [Megalops cyprinoides]|uniref:oxygen-regulated protein 1 n=1 Tax=Megalops cyprinoides TaxID=118141 RepID=UPI00186541AB|nr:oxygen-regulated protein 1 [Megalops cyprinoides]
MSEVAPPDGPLQDPSMGSVQTLASWPPNIADPLAPKRVCFYKSGDPQFSGIRMVISGRNFKTFEALLDGLSEKVPLPFGVRTITTPRGTHLLHSLDELEDGKSYICSDQKKVKPIDLETAGSKPLPWNASLQASRGRRTVQLSMRGDGRPAKRLTVFRNGDARVRHTVLLQRKNGQTFEALLALISEVLGFPVKNLHTTDGQRIDGLPALSLCSGAVVASGNEPFRSDSYDLQKPTQSTGTSSLMEPDRLQPASWKSNSLSRSSRNISPSSEHYYPNQVNASLAGSIPLGSVDTETLAGVGDVAEGSGLVPPEEEDIEKSFRINQDGSMTVEMKVRLMIKQEETIHWTTTLVRSSVTGQLGGEAASGEGAPEGNSPDSNATLTGDPKDVSVQGHKVRKQVAIAGAEGVREEGEEVTPTAVCDVERPRIRRAPTPGPRRRRKKPPSTDSINTLSSVEVQENIVGTYTYKEQAPGGSVAEKHSSRPTPKPRSAVPAGADRAEVRSTFRSSRSAEILQIQNSGGEVTESVMQVYEEQSSYDTYFANAKVTGECQSVTTTVCSRTVSMDTAPCSSSNDTGQRRPSSASESLNGQKAGTLSPSPDAPPPSCTIRNDLSSFTDNEAHAVADSPSEFSLHDTDCSERAPPEGPAGQGTRRAEGKPEKPKAKKRAALLPAGMPRKGGGALGDGRRVKSSSDVASGAEPEKGDGRIREGMKSEQGPGRTAKRKKVRGDGDFSPRSLPLSLNIKHRNESVKELNLKKEGSVGTGRARSSASKNVLDVPPPRKSLVKQRSMSDDRKDAKEAGELSESVSLPALRTPPSAVSEYVEDWLDKMQPDPVSCVGDGNESASEPAERVLFRIGSDSPEESETKSEIGTLSEDHLARKHNAEMEAPLAAEAKMKPLLEQLCSSIRSIGEITQGRRLSCLEKSHSVPDFSSHVASMFGASSKVLIAFLSVMSLTDGIAGLSRDQPLATDLSCSEALQMLKALHKMASIEDADELKNSLSDLHRSASSRLLQKWRSFQELSNQSESCDTSLGSSENTFPSEASLEQSNRHQEQPFGIQHLMGELGISDDLQKELSSLVNREMNDFNRNEDPSESEDANSFVESATKEELELEDFGESVQEKDIDSYTECLQEKDAGESLYERGADDFEESVLEKEVDDSTECVQQNEADDFEESVLEKEADDFSEPVQVKEVDDFAESVTDEDKAVEHAISGSDPLCVGAEEDTEQQSSALEEASYIEEWGRYAEEPVSFAVQDGFVEERANGKQGKVGFGKMDTVSEVSEPADGCSVSHLSSAEHPKMEEFTRDDSEVPRGLDQGGGAELQGVPEEAEELDCETVYHCVEIPDHLLRVVSSVLMSSSLVLCHDSKGSLRIEPDSACVGSITAKGNTHPRYGQIQLPTPNTSDLSDYRAETTDSDGRSSQLSEELSSEGAGEDLGGLYITQGCEGTLDGEKDADDVESEEKYALEKHHVDSLISESPSRTKEMAELSYFNTTGSYDLERDPPQCPGAEAEPDVSEGVLIDKGRWLLRENHLIRRSPPAAGGMYGNADTTSMDTSDDVPYSHFGSQRSAMEILSSDELEDLARPATPKCTYFNMPHGSDSDPFQDSLSVTSRTSAKVKANTNGARKKKDPKVAPLAEAEQALPKRHGSMSSFASVEFKPAGNKVHPQRSGATPVVTQPARAENTAAAAARTLQEQDSLEKLHLVCGQHCPIL